MKVIFLDFDGVLNNEGTACIFGYDNPKLSHYNQACPDPTSVRLIDILIEKSDAYVVVSSSWRNGNTLPELQIILANEFRLRNWHKVIDSTPQSHMSQWTKRGNQIQDWLFSHSNIDEYVIIDDDADMLAHQKDNFVLIDPDYGFSHPDLLKCYDILKVERK